MVVWPSSDTVNVVLNVRDPLGLGTVVGTPLRT